MRREDCSSTTQEATELVWWWMNLAGPVEEKKACVIIRTSPWITATCRIFCQQTKTKARMDAGKRRRYTWTGASKQMKPEGDVGDPVVAGWPLTPLTHFSLGSTSQFVSLLFPSFSSALSPLVLLLYPAKHQRRHFLLHVDRGKRNGTGLSGFNVHL